MLNRATLLAVSSELPWPLNAGGRLRTFHLLRAIAQRFKVHLVVGGHEPDPAAVAALAAHDISATVAVLPRRTVLSEVLKAGRCGLTGQPYVLYGRHGHAAMHAQVTALGDRLRPAVLYLDHLDSFQYRHCCAGAVAVVDLHNVYSLVAARWADERAGPMRVYLRREAAMLGRAERDAAAGADLLFAVSPQERRYYEQCGARHVRLVPNGVDSALYATLPVGRDTSLIAYVGSMSWRPNAEAAMYLATAILPQVRAQVPDVRLRIIGRDPDAALLALNGRDGVEVTGEVPSMLPHLREAAVLAVPLESGGGTRLKILEALAAGVPTVSTPVGAEGLDLEAGVHLLVLEREQFADGLVRLLRDRVWGTALAARGRAAVTEHYDWSSIGESAAAAIAERILTPSPATAAAGK